MKMRDIKINDVIGILAETWKIFRDKNEGIEMLINLCNKPIRERIPEGMSSGTSLFQRQGKMRDYSSCRGISLLRVRGKVLYSIMAVILSD